MDTTSSAKRLSSLNKYLPFIILAAFFLVAPAIFVTRTWINVFILTFVSIVGSCGLRTISLSGNLSFAQAAFIGIGAYFSGVMAKTFELPMGLTIPLGAIVAMLIGLAIGFPFARLRNIYYCMASMFMGVAIIQFISAFQVTGGANGIIGIPSLGRELGKILDLPGIGPALENAGVTSVQLCYYLFLLVTAFSLVCLYRFEHSRIGWTLRTLSQSPEVAASIGINEVLYRQLSVAFGCFFAGLSGAMYAHYSTTLSPNNYTMGTALWLLMYMMIGGSNKFIGPIIGAIILEFIKQLPTILTSMSGLAGATDSFVAFTRWAGQYSAYTPFLTAAALIAVCYWMPGGLVSIPGKIRGAIRGRGKEGR
jgi:branched-chain amino acid transport system permease protein